MTAEKLTDSNGNTYYRSGNLCGGREGKWIEVWKPEDAVLEDGVVLLRFHHEESELVLTRLKAGGSTNVRPEDIPAAIELLQTIREQK